MADKEEDYTPELCRLQLDALATLLDLHIMRSDPLDISARSGQLLKKFKMDVEHFTQWTDAEKKPLAKVHHTEIWGSRDLKYQTLEESNLTSLPFEKIETLEPFYFFVPQNYEDNDEYQSGFSLSNIFPINVTGILTARDSLVIGFNKEELTKRIENFADSRKTDDQIRSEFFGKKKSEKYLSGDTRGWKMSEARNKISGFNHSEKIETICYRPYIS